MAFGTWTVYAQALVYRPRGSRGVQVLQWRIQFHDFYDFDRDVALIPVPSAVATPAVERRLRAEASRVRGARVTRVPVLGLFVSLPDGFFRSLITTGAAHNYPLFSPIVTPNILGARPGPSEISP